MNEKNGGRLLKLLSAMLAAGLIIGLTGCSTTRQVSRGVKPSGFLGDYSQLRKGVKNEPVYSYWNFSAHWNHYGKIIIDPVQLWKSDDPHSPFAHLSREKQQMLVSALHTALYDRLSKDYTIVNQPGPDVLRLRAAITEARPSKPVIDLVSSVYPAAVALSYGDQTISGTGIGVGAVDVEGELLDSQTNERLAAAVDRRSGTKAWQSKFRGPWGDVKSCFDWWANLVGERLAKEKAASAATASR